MVAGELLKKPLKYVGKCTSLGLAIAKQIVVEMYRSTIIVNPKTGLGNGFIVLLPICELKSIR